MEESSSAPVLLLASFFFFAIYNLEMMTIRAATGGVLGPHYSSSKAALHGLMHWVARQYSKKGIVSVTMVTTPSISC